MIWIERLVYLIGGLVALAVILYSLTSLWGWERVWERVAGPADLGPVEFARLAKKPNPNQALVCPSGLCKDSDVDIGSPIYTLNAAQTAKLAEAALAGVVDGIRVDDRKNPAVMRYVFRSKWMRFPDTLELRAHDVPDGQSTISIYSRSQIGRSDFGVNLARVKMILEALKPHEE